MDKKISMKKQKITRYILSILLLSSLPLFAEDPPVFVDDVVDNTPASPINDWIPLLVLVSIAMAYYIIYKQKSKSNS